MLKSCKAVCAGEPESLACRVKEEVPDTAGVPVRAPVAAARLIPVGSAPALTLHVYGGIPPLAWGFAEYAVPTVPVTRELVVILIADGFCGFVPGGAALEFPDTTPAQPFKTNASAQHANPGSTHPVQILRTLPTRFTSISSPSRGEFWSNEPETLPRDH